MSRAYLDQVASGRICHDEEQVAVAAQLDALYQALLAAPCTTAVPTRPRLSLAAITDVKPRNPLARAQQAWYQWIHNYDTMLRQPRKQGVYIYGSVGVGKSFLMDLFHHQVVKQQQHDKTTVLSHRRAHFHEFMLDVHQRIHAAKQLTPRGDVLPEVALSLATEAQLLCFDEFQVGYLLQSVELGRHQAIHGANSTD